MIWALLAAIGVPIWLIVGVLLGAFVSRRRFTAQPGVFRMKLKAPEASGWPRRTAYGRVVHDVLVTTVGLALLRTGVHAVVYASESATTESVKPFEHARILDLRFGDGSTTLLAVDESQFRLIEPLTSSSRSS